MTIKSGLSMQRLINQSHNQRYTVTQWIQNTSTKYCNMNFGSTFSNIVQQFRQQHDRNTSVHPNKQSINTNFIPQYKPEPPRTPKPDIHNQVQGTLPSSSYQPPIESFDSVCLNRFQNQIPVNSPSFQPILHNFPPFPLNTNECMYPNSAHNITNHSDQYNGNRNFYNGNNRPFQNKANNYQQKGNCHVKHGCVVDSKRIYYCEPCDKELSSAAYSAHISTHEKCHFAGCEFSATKKIVSAHYYATHGLYSGSGFKQISIDGQSFTVLLGSNPVEIEQWRAARKSNYPTQENIKNKKNRISQLHESGGILNPSQRVNKRQKFAKNDDKRNNRKKRTENKIDTNEQSVSNNIVHDNSSSACDFSSVACNKDSNGLVSDVQSQNITVDGINSADAFDRSKDSLVSNLIVEDEVDHDVKVKNSMLLKDSKNDSKNVEGNVFYRTGVKKNGLFLPDPLSGGVQGTLLQSLLKQEVDKEDNIVLQCIRFIVESNFLQIEDV